MGLSATTSSASAAATATTLDNRGWAGDSDKLVFDADIAHDQLWLSNPAAILIDVIGEDDKVRVADWFDGTDNTVATIEAGDGLSLAAGNVAGLVSAMAAFAPPTDARTSRWTRPCTRPLA